MRVSLIFVIVLSFMIVPSGCISTKSNPVEITQFSILKTDSSRHLFGIWLVEFDLQKSTSKITPLRSANYHFKVTGYLPPPVIMVNSWDPVNEIIDVDVEIRNENPWQLNGNDLRLIIYSDDYGHKLLNVDEYTDLYDIPGGDAVNPFKAYAKDISYRIFSWQTSQTENLQIECPGGNFFVQFAIDASYPTNCDEPYMITNFVQDVDLFDREGSLCTLTVEVYDWQNDVNSVLLLCPEITSEQSIPFEYDTGNLWKLNLSNNSGTPAGEYEAIIKATSSSSGALALYDIVTITVRERGSNGFAFPVGYPDATGYTLDASDGQVWMNYFPPYGYHLGEDWTGIGGGNNDCDDPVYAIADGIVTYAEDLYSTWGNVAIIRHDNVDGSGTMTSYYGHLNDMYVNLGDLVTAGQQIGTIGDAHGRFYCHLHFEIRLGDSHTIGSAFVPSPVDEGPLGQINPSEFINAHYDP